MNPTLQGVLSVLGRLFLVTIFVMSAVGNKIPKFDQVVPYMESHGVPQPETALRLAIAFLLVGGLTVLVGWQARFGALLLAVFLVLATYYFHAFWKFEGKEAEMQMIQFMKNLGLFGAMLFVMGNGAGAWSVDGWLKSRGQGQMQRQAG
jgi:putative oxidoreductase